MEEKIEQLCAELGGLADMESRTALLERSPHLLQATVVQQLAEAVRQQVRVDLLRALALAEAAVAIARQLHDKEALARGLRAKANALWLTGQCKAAIGLFQEAERMFEEVGNMSEVGRTLSTSIQSLALLGEYGAAFVAAERAGEIFGRLGENLRVARLEINVANIHHRQGHFDQALATYERAYQKLLPHNEMEAIGVALHNIGVCHIALDDFRGALEAYRRLRSLCEQHDMPLLVTQADYNSAYLFYLRGDYTQALTLLWVTRETCYKSGDKYHLALCDLDQSEIYLELSLIEEAAEMAQKGFDQFEELGMPFEAARSLGNLAIAAGLQAMSFRSLELFARAKDMFLREKNRNWPSLLDLYQALVLFNEGNFVEARRLCRTASEFFRSTSLLSKYALCELLLARLSLQDGDLEAALLSCESALRSAARIGAPSLSCQAYFVMGQIQEALREADKAYDSYQKSRSALEALRNSLQGEELKIGFMKSKMEVYHRLIHLCLNRDSTQTSTEEAFSYVEEAKARSLRDLIVGRGGLASRKNEPDQRTRELREELNWYYHRIEREQLSQDGASPELIESLQLRARAHEHELLRRSRESPPSQLARNARPATLAEIRASLHPDSALVEYFCIGEQIFAAVVTKERLTITRLTLVSRVTDRLRMLQFQMSTFRLSRDYTDHFHEALLRATQSHLQELYNDVFAPLRHLLEVQHLIIVPYGPLHALPFPGLYDGRQYLIERFTICHASSASIYALSRRESRISAGQSLIVGVEDPKIPCVRQEIEAVAAVVPDPKILLGPDASALALREQGCVSRIIHIATHGYFRHDNPMFSAIRLADSYLNLYDLYDMNFPVELLTLSACVTGLNVVAEGDELLGLTRGLLYAGAQSLLLSLWDVNDQSTAEFMSLFYFRALDHGNKAQALRAAMLELRTRYPHPYHWAPFKLIVEGS